MLLLQKVFSGHESIKRAFLKVAPWLLLVIFHLLFIPYMVRNSEYILLTILSSIYLFAVHENRTTLSSIFRDFTIFWMSATCLTVFLKFSNAIYLIGILPIFAMKQDSIRSTTRSLLWIVCIFLMLLISEIDVGKGLFIKEYFLEILFLLIFIFFTNIKSGNIRSLQYYVLTLGCFNSLITHYSYIPYTFKYIFIGVQVFTLLRFYVEKRVQNLILTTLCFTILIIPSISAISNLQICLMIYVGFMVMKEFIKNVQIQRYVQVILSTFVIYLVFAGIENIDMLTKFSGFILIVNILIAGYQKLMISDTFVHS